jgi:hypothetical protein
VYSPIEILCSAGEHWHPTTPVDLQQALKRQGYQPCGKCSGRCPDLAEQYFLDHAKSVNFIPLSRFISTHDDVMMLCPAMHICIQKPSNFYSVAKRGGGNGCSECAGTDTAANNRKARGILQAKNYSLVSQGRLTTDEWRVACHNPAHPVWATSGKRINRGNGCPTCFADSLTTPHIQGGDISRIVVRWKKDRKSTLSHTAIKAVIDPAISAIYKAAKRQKQVVDHIIPLAWADSDDINQIAVLSAVVNLQLLSFSANAKKKNNLTEQCQNQIVSSPQLREALRLLTRIPPKWQAWAKTV